jgi:hypothetical protein
MKETSLYIYNDCFIFSQGTQELLIKVIINYKFFYHEKKAIRNVEFKKRSNF